MHDAKACAVAVATADCPVAVAEALELELQLTAAVGCASNSRRASAARMEGPIFDTDALDVGMRGGEGGVTSQPK